MINNELRTNPQKFVSYLEEEMTHFKPDGTTLVRKLPDGRNMNVRKQEGISAYKEALADLKKTKAEIDMRSRQPPSHPELQPSGAALGGKAGVPELQHSVP